MPISAFIVRVPAAEALVQAMRLRFDATAGQGVPAHITVLVPFLVRQLVTPEVVRTATAAFATVRAFAFTLNAVHRWPQTVVQTSRVAPGLSAGWPTEANA